MPTATKAKGAAALVGSAFIYATFGLFVRLMDPMFGSRAQVAFRLVLGFVILVLFVHGSRRRQALSRAATLKAVLLGLSFASMVLFFTLSATHTKIANAVFTLYAGSMLTSLLIGTAIFKERLTTLKVGAIVLSLVGLSLYADDLAVLNLGVIAGFLSGVSDGIANGMRRTLKGVDRTTVLQYQFGFAAIFGLGLMLLSSETAIKTVSLLPLLAGVVFTLAHLGLSRLLLYGFQHFDVNVGTVILACELVIASFLGWLFFQETPTPAELTGGLFIFVASILATVDVPALFGRRRPA